ncbi:glycerate kinase [Luteolibacter flavescens]|uniref:Glycerate kinase n=1 Tax=Luteolibacter flavescens TaxID=1859460 RepID=A0ABT3FQS7_9BACT|nr:glycerate kinase [Luteolibacter flavescens]MCW1885920.1 glycerate kinase [Luteolibacter flavescens]
MRVLLACDKFKGSLGAAEACEAIRAGLPDDWSIDICPIADGGEGFVDAMLAGSGGDAVNAPCADALGRPIGASYGVYRSNDEVVAVLEMSAASGIWRIPAGERQPRLASTHGTGLLMRHAIKVSGATKLLIGIGGSVTNDGGAGMAAALGVKFLDEQGRELQPIPADLANLHAIDFSGRIPLPEIIVACDVDNPLAGPRGASAVFGPQKGATPEDVEFLDAVLSKLATISEGEAEATTPGAGAAGGLGFGLLRFAGAKLVPGFDLVADALGLADRLRSADLVITGEGSLDVQTLGGKGPAGVAAMAKAAGIPVAAVAGRIEDAVRPLFDACLSLESFGLPVAESIARAPELVTALVAQHADLLRGLAAR